MKKLLIFCGIITIFHIIHGQESNNQDKRTPAMAKGKVEGTIIDSETGQPVEYANVAIYRKADSSLVTGTITGPDGSFAINKIRPGRYYMTINFIGYDKIYKNLNVSSQNPNIQLGQMKLNQAATNIEGVEVVADQARIEYKIDRKVVNVGQELTAAGGSAIDVLENTPSVNVDIEGNVTLRGSGNFTVLIDGKPTVLEGSDALQQIPASTIKNIEIITNPSAKYDPDGMAGIINIVLKKNRGGGISGIVNATAGVRDKYSGDFLLNYKTSKFNAYVGADINEMNYHGNMEGTRQIFNNDTTTFVQTEMERVFTRQGKVLKGGFDYYINDMITLTLSGDVGQYKGGRASSGNMHEFTTPSTTNLYFFTEDQSLRSRDYYSLNMNYNQKFNEEGHEITGLLYYNTNNGGDEEQEWEYLTDEQWNKIDELPITQIRTNEVGDGYQVRIKADYTRPFDNGKLEAGYQSRIDSDNEGFLFEEFDPETREYINNENYSSSMKFNRNIQAGYFTFSQSMSFFDYQLGLRTEYTDRRLSDTRSAKEFVINRLDYFPTIHLSKKFQNDHQVLASYSRRIERPRGYYLEPFTTYMNRYNIREGNPDLEPEYIDSYELGYHKKSGMNFISFETYYRLTNNKITRILEQVPDTNITIHKYENLDRDHALGSELMLNIEPLKWLRVNLTGNGYYYKLEGAVTDQETVKESFNWDMRLNTTARLSPTTRFQVNGFYFGPTVTAQGERDGFWGMNAAFRQDFLKRTLSATLQVRNIFGSMRYSFNTSGPGFRNDIIFTRESQIVMLTLSYKINNYKNREKGTNGEGGGGMNMEDADF
ncbi:MAG: TonB-dependent receptor domain-containing protein [Bacteroidales bacterium]